MPRKNRSPPTNTNKKIEAQAELDLTEVGDCTSNTANTRKIRFRLEERKKRRMEEDEQEDEEVCCESTQFEDLKSTIESWKADQDNILKRLVADVAELKLQNQSIKDSNAEIVKSMKFMNQEYEDMKKKIEEFEREKRNLHECILGLENRIKDAQYMSRTSSVEIRNIPASDKETPSHLLSLVSKIGTAVNVKIGSNDLRDVYRIPGKKGMNRGIVAEFATVNTKSSLLSAVKNYNKNQGLDSKLNTETIGVSGKRQPVYIAEFLPPSTRQTFYAARNFAKNNRYDFCWVSNGNVLIRKEVGAKHIHIRSEKCLLELEPRL